MKKIRRLFLRDENRVLLNQVEPECDWVLAGEGVPTRKYDGTSCAIIEQKLYKRYDNKKLREVQQEWVHCGDTSERGKNIYWVPIAETDYYHRKGLVNTVVLNDEYPIEGTYELCGPKINKNKEQLTQHILIPHGLTHSEECDHLKAVDPRTFESIKDILEVLHIEGIVWHHEDGRMCKITKRNFGIER